MTSAKIIASNGKSVEWKELEGVFTCLLEHEVKETRATFEYTGPKITREEWDKVLRFFKWTYAQEKSESQVRLFVHPVHGWLAHAFPQKGGTGMTTREIDSEDAKAQRAALPEGYTAFGTVHHHCSSSAFQSGVDRADEETVDGLHITIGKLDQDQMDLHARLYIKGNQFEPNLASMWDIGEDKRALLAQIKALDFDDSSVANKIARQQMCQSPAVLEGEDGFPGQWKTNYILPEWRGRTDWEWGDNHKNHGLVGNGTIPPGSVWCYHCQSHVTDHFNDNCPKAKKSRKEKRNGHGGNYDEAEAVKAFCNVAAIRWEMQQDEALAWLSAMKDDADLWDVLVKIMERNDLSLVDLVCEAEKALTELEGKEAASLEKEAKEYMDAAAKGDGMEAGTFQQ